MVPQFRAGVTTRRRAASMRDSELSSLSSGTYAACPHSTRHSERSVGIPRAKHIPRRGNGHVAAARTGFAGGFPRCASVQLLGQALRIRSG